MFDLLSIYTTSAIIGAASSYAAARQESEHQRRLPALEAEEEAWFAEHILPNLAGDDKDIGCYPLVEQTTIPVH